MTAIKEVLTPKTIGGLIPQTVGTIPPEAQLNMLIYGDPGSGKGHPYGTRVLTPTGLIPVEKLDYGMEVISNNGWPCIVTGVYDRGELSVFRVVFNDGSSVLVDGDHLWACKDHNARNRGGTWKTIETRELASSLPKRWHIPITEPVHLSERKLALHPYVLGVLLGDGMLHRSSIHLATDDFTVKAFSERLPTDVDIAKLSKPGNYLIRTERGQPNPVLNEVRRLGVNKPSHEKFIPEEYLYSSLDQRLALLRGLMDTDGELHIHKGRATINFSSSSEALRDGVKFLVESLGGVARCGFKESPRYTYREEVKIGKPSYRLSINIPINPFLTRRGFSPQAKYQPTRVIQSIEPEGTAPVRCISVDSPTKLYLTEHCLVTHNTWLAGSADEVPEFRRVLHIDIEGGSKTLRRTFPGVETVRVTKWKQIEDLEEDLFRNDCYDFNTVILDNGTEAQNRCKRLVKDNAIAKANADEDSDPDVFHQKHWGILHERFMTTMRNFIDLSCNFICTAWAMEVNDNHGKRKWRPMVQGSAKHDFPGLSWSIVGYLRSEQTKEGESIRVLATRETKDWLAKQRDTDLPPDLGNPTMADILTYIPKGETD